MIIITAKLLHQFEVYLRDSENSPHTISKYLRDVQKLTLLVGNKLSSREQIITFKHKLQQLSYAARSINSMLSSIHRFLKFCGKTEWKVRFLKLQHQVFADSCHELTRTDYHTLVIEARRRGKDQLDMILQTICSTGIRVSELRAITIESLHTGIAVIHAKGKIRQILLPATLCQMLLKYCRCHGIETGAVFVTRFGNIPDRSNLWKAFKELAQTAHIEKQKVFPHNLRHLFARCFYQKYKDIVYLADILGHSSIDTTRIYTHLYYEK